MGQDAVRNGRLGSKKVKTGCFTCKIRRVKCDEAKPDCERCTKSGRRCDGYRSCSPLLQREHDWISKPRDPTIFVITPERLLASFVVNEQEQRSFDFYRERTASSLAHTLDSTFWTEFILQVSHSEPAVRHALVAIGALNERLRSPTEDALISSKDDQSLKLALNSYNKAIKHLTMQMQKRNSDLIALLTCILFICIEFLQENITEALTLVHQGCAILRTQQKPSNEEHGDQKSPTQQVMIEHQVLPMFNRLTVLSALCGRPATLIVPSEPAPDACLPFIDLRGARASLYLLMNQGHEIIRKSDDCKWIDGANPSLSCLRLECSSLQAKLNQWHANFTQLRADIELSKSTRLIQAISLLSMYFTTTSIWLATCLERAQVAYDAHLKQFTQIVEAAELFINLSEGQPASEILFTFEMGLVPPLYFTSTKCRVPAVRRRAMSLIKRAPGKEGMWDRTEILEVAGKAIVMEEGNKSLMEDGNCVPEEAARLHDVQFDREYTRPGQRKTVVRYVSKPAGLVGPWCVRKEYFDA